MEISVQLLVFGAFTLIIVAGTYVVRNVGQDSKAAVPTKAIGLITLATFGAVLATTRLDSAGISAAYGLLGTIGGYLAGTRSATPKNGTDSGRSDSLGGIE